MYSGQILKFEGLQLSSLTSITDQILKDKSIKGLSISNNRFRSLPRNLSKLSHLEYLDISGNLFTCKTRDLLISLQTLPNLK